MDIVEQYFVGSLAKSGDMHIERHFDQAGITIVALLEKHRIAVGAHFSAKHHRVDAGKSRGYGLHVVGRGKHNHLVAKQVHVQTYGIDRLARVIDQPIIIGVRCLGDVLVDKLQTIGPAHLGIPGKAALGALYRVGTVALLTSNVKLDRQRAVGHRCHR